MMKHIWSGLTLTLVLASPAFAQGPIVIDPSQARVSFEIDPGLKAGADGILIPRPITEVGFDMQIDSGAFQSTGIDRPCVARPAPATDYTCTVRFVPMTPGAHAIRVRGRDLTVPALTGPASSAINILSAVVFIGPITNARPAGVVTVPPAAVPSAARPRE